MKRMGKEFFLSKTEDIITTYHLSKSCEFGYDYYSCDSSAGLSSYNKEPYMKLRQDFNAKKRKDATYYVMLYVLIREL